ncbi:MAG TPA: extracellular solute-binding protein [Chloroflexota bacterium]|nr:extracellular solute-binding protein [Chloroflexota bacterium]
MPWADRTRQQRLIVCRWPSALLLIALAASHGSCAPVPPPSSTSGTAAGPAAVAGPPTRYEDLALYSGADRDAALLAGAQREGTVTWYTSLAGIGPQVVADAFQQRYGVPVDLYRADDANLLKRFTEEQRAGRYAADAIETTGAAIQELARANQIIPFYTVHAGTYPGRALRGAGTDRVLGIVDRESYQVFAYNTRLFSRDAAPRTYRDLARPDFRGKLVMAGTSTGVNQVGNWLLNVGGDFVEQMQQQQIQIQNVSGAAVLGLVVTGEFPASPTTFREHHVELRQKDPDAPADYVPLEPVVTNAGTIVLPVGAPHPNAAILFADWIVAPDGGQAVLEQLGRGSAAKDPGFQRWYPDDLPPDRLEAQYEDWQRRLYQLGGLR